MRQQAGAVTGRREPARRPVSVRRRCIMRTPRFLRFTPRARATVKIRRFRRAVQVVRVGGRVMRCERLCRGRARSRFRCVPVAAGHPEYHRELEAVPLSPLVAKHFGGVRKASTPLVRSRGIARNDDNREARGSAGDLLQTRQDIEPGDVRHREVEQERCDSADTRDSEGKALP
jgi:hypothetical protein